MMTSTTEGSITERPTTEGAATGPRTPLRPSGSPNPVHAVALGVLGGLLWSAALRAYMSEIAGRGSEFHWPGTFIGVLVPGAVAGGLLGYAYARRALGRTRGLRWLGLAPFAFAIGPLLLPGAVVDLVTSGLGAGAIALPVGAIAAGYAISGAGPVWARIATGIPGLGMLAAVVVVTPILGGAPLALTPEDARGGWVLVLIGSLMAALALAASIPFRPVR